MKFSVLMSVYAKESPEYFSVAVDSILAQTVMPDEIVLVRDGKVPENLQHIIDGYIKDYPTLFTYIPLEENGGLGNALNVGLKAARNDLVARMDTDDISLPERFAFQTEFMLSHPEIDVCGGQIAEFIVTPDQPTGKRKVPCDDTGIKNFIKKRNPFNHMTVMFRKNAVLAVGSYLDMHYVEDYYLWCRMMINGSSFGNLPQTLVHARIGEDMYSRRGGYKYFKSWKMLEKYKLKNDITNCIDYVITLVMRFFVLVMIPNRLRGWILRNFSREKQ